MRSTLPLLALLCSVGAQAQAEVYAMVGEGGIRLTTIDPDAQRIRPVMPSNAAAPGPAPLPEVSHRSPALPKGLSQGASPPFGVNTANRHRYSHVIAQVARQYGLDPQLIHAVISAESAFDPDAVSPAGAMGLMQLMPATARRFGIDDPDDPVANIKGGARYLRVLLDQFKTIRLALAGYNAGEAAVVRYGNAVPPYQETREYVGRVLGFYRYYRGVSQ